MESNQNKGWNWLAFFFAPAYYAGYGKLKKGIIYAVISGFPLFGIVIAILGGKNANKELPVGRVDFNWRNAVIAIVITLVSGFVLKTTINALNGVSVTDKQAKKLSVCVETREDTYALSRGTIGDLMTYYDQLQKNSFEMYPIKGGKQLIYSLGGETIMLDTQYRALEKGACMEIVSAKVKSDGQTQEYTKEDSLRSMAQVAEYIFKF